MTSSGAICEARGTRFALRPRPAHCVESLPLDGVRRWHTKPKHVNNSAIGSACVDSCPLPRATPAVLLRLIFSLERSGPWLRPNWGEGGPTDWLTAAEAVGNMILALKVREHSSAVERCGPHVAISPAVLRSSNMILALKPTSLIFVGGLEFDTDLCAARWVLTCSPI